MMLFDPAQPGTEAHSHWDSVGGLHVHTTRLMLQNVIVYTVQGVPAYAHFSVTTACGMSFHVFRPPYVAEAFIAAGYHTFKWHAAPVYIIDSYRQEFDGDPITEGEIKRVLAELAGTPTAEDCS